jgi:1-acyl-sn-glycerol-3-phosphate acyltransferase
MSDEEPDLSLRDAEYLGRFMPLLRFATRYYFRSEVRDVERIPAEGGALVVSNHSGGLIAMDVPVIAVAYFDHYGMDAPLYVLAHDMLWLDRKTGEVFDKAGFLKATRRNAHAVLVNGGTTIVFPGGDYDVFRPTKQSTTIDFNGRTGYVRTALEAGVPLVPVVTIGGQEQMYVLWRGELLAKLLRLEKLLRTKYMPVSFGFPFGLTFAFPPNLPLPSKLVTQVLEPIDVRAEFGEDPDIAEVDVEVRRRMQEAMDDLAAQRRFPVLG